MNDQVYIGTSVEEPETQPKHQHQVPHHHASVVLYCIYSKFFKLTRKELSKNGFKLLFIQDILECISTSSIKFSHATPF